MPPGDIEPQFTEVTGVVHAASEYMPIFGVVVIVPVDVRFWLTVTAASVEAVKAKAVSVSMIMRVLEVLVSVMCFAPFFLIGILRLNKRCFAELRMAHTYNMHTKPR